MQCKEGANLGAIFCKEGAGTQGSLRSSMTFLGCVFLLLSKQFLMHTNSFITEMSFIFMFTLGS